MEYSPGIMDEIDNFYFRYPFFEMKKSRWIDCMKLTLKAQLCELSKYCVFTRKNHLKVLKHYFLQIVLRR
jgi:hypothetical protein